MKTLSSENVALVVVDLQGRLMPAIHEGAGVVTEVTRLIAGARVLGVPLCATEQNPKGLGPTLDTVDLQDAPVFPKMTFDATRAPGLLDFVPEDSLAVVTGCEAHVCVLQTVLGLLSAGRKVAVVLDAIGARKAESKETALDRMARHGAEIVTTEMVLFEWLGSAEHPAFKDLIQLIK